MENTGPKYLISKFLTHNAMTQRQFAEKIGCTTAFVNGLVHGKNTNIKISLIHKIHRITKIPHKDLILDLLSCKK